MLLLVPPAGELASRVVDVGGGDSRRVELPDLAAGVPVGGAQPRVAARASFPGP